MANQSSLDIAIAPLGALSTASGTFQPSAYGASNAQVEAGARIIGSANAYSSVGASALQGVCCMDDRLEGWLRLAGGALALALMKNFAQGGTLLSEDLRWLKAQGFYLLFHEDCGALANVLTILGLLSDSNAAGYRLLEADGVVVSMDDRRAIAAWAAGITAGYVDVDAARQVVHEIQPFMGQHVAGYATVIDRPNTTFDAAKKVEDASGLKTFVITTWVADQAAPLITADPSLQRRAATVAKVLSAQAVLLLGGPEMVTGLVKR